MWSIVITTILLFSLGLMMMAWLLYKTNPDRIDPEWLTYGNCCWFSFSTFIGESVMRWNTETVISLISPITWLAVQVRGQH